MKRLTFLILALVIIACTPSSTINGECASPGVTIKHLQWLVGTWKSVKGKEISYEIWTQENDSLLKGIGYVLLNADTVFSEKLQIVQNGNELFYVPAVGNQNNGQPVYFKFMEFNKGEFNFVNKDHDFPQRIIYKNPQPDFLCARIEGTKEGKLTKVDFNFLKVKN
ncbi:MAG: hypothetical protein H0W61_13490 [Bacteroidetes bacterium]|nr:hypothetical protein [Bacteroidota bacterium]